MKVIRDKITNVMTNNGIANVIPNMRRGLTSRFLKSHYLLVVLFIYLVFLSYFFIF